MRRQSGAWATGHQGAGEPWTWGRCPQQTPPRSNAPRLRLAHRPRPCLPAGPRCRKEPTLTGAGPSAGAPFSPLAPGTVLGLPSAPPEPWGLPEPGGFRESTLQSLPGSAPSSRGAHVDILLREQRLGAFICGPRAKRKNVPGIPAHAAPRGPGLFFRFQSMEEFCSLQDRTKPRALGPPSYRGMWGGPAEASSPPRGDD